MWWRSAVVYQVYPRSFADSDEDGIGDLGGIRARLDYLTGLGVDAVWLSPIYRSPMADFGYDVSDHTAIDPVFGDLRDFDRLVSEAHARDVRVLLDWVPNHTSSEHAWFVESRSSRSSPKRDWYVWRDGRGAGPPNNWLSAFGGPAWTWDEDTAQWYLHLFLPEQPDLNWGNDEVVDAMHGVLRFWLDRGVDGFRADVVHLIGKDEQLPDRPQELAHLHPVNAHDHANTHPLLRGIRATLAAYDGDRVMVGEVPLPTPAHLVPYYGVDDELHMVFNFSLMHVPWSAAAFASVLVETEQAFAPAGLWPCWALSNHDQPRQRSRLDDSEPRARAAALVLLTLRGTPCLYAGEELGLLDARIPPARRVDPGGRDGSRAPIPWRAAAPHGWPAAPWLPWPPEPELWNAETESGSPDSMLALYRRLLAVRRGSPALQLGSWRLLDSPPETLVYERAYRDDVRRVAVNFSDRPVHAVTDPAGRRVELTTRPGGASRGWDGSLGPAEAVILAPADARQHPR